MNEFYDKVDILSMENGRKALLDKVERLLLVEDIDVSTMTEQMVLRLPDDREKIPVIEGYIFDWLVSQNSKRDGVYAHPLTLMFFDPNVHKLVHTFEDRTVIFGKTLFDHELQHFEAIDYADGINYISIQFQLESLDFHQQSKVITPSAQHKRIGGRKLSLEEEIRALLAPDYPGVIDIATVYKLLIECDDSVGRIADELLARVPIWNGAYLTQENILHRLFPLYYDLTISNGSIDWEVYPDDLVYGLINNKIPDRMGLDGFVHEQSSGWSILPELYCFIKGFK